MYIYFLFVSLCVYYMYNQLDENSSVSSSESDDETKSDDGENEKLKVK